MANFLVALLYMVIMVVVILAIMFLGRKFIFSKVRINKYIPLGIAVVAFLAQLIISLSGVNMMWLTMLLSIIAVTFFLWFMDIVTTGGPKKKEKEIVIRPKAKPNRVKHLNKNNK